MAVDKRASSNRLTTCRLLTNSLVLLIAFSAHIQFSFAQETANQRFIISLDSDPNARNYEDYYVQNRTDLDVAGITVLRAMREKSTLSQVKWIQKLNDMVQNGKITDFQPLWLIDAIIVTADDSMKAIFESDKNIKHVYDDIALTNQRTEPVPVDTSVFHKLRNVISNLKAVSSKKPLNNGDERRIALIGSYLPEFYPYGPEDLRTRETEETFLIEGEAGNWDWLAVSAAGWSDSWDDRGIASSSSFEYIPIFNDGYTVNLSDMLLILEELMDIADGKKKPDVIGLTWNVMFGVEYELLWEAIRAIEYSQTPVVMIYPESSSAPVNELPGLFVQGYTDQPRLSEYVLDMPQLLQTPDGSVYFTELVSLGYAVGALALLRNSNNRSIIKNRYNALRYGAGYGEDSAFDLDVVVSALNLGITSVEGTLTQAGSRTPLPGVLVEVVTLKESKSAKTDERGLYEINIVSDDAVIKINDTKFYPDSLVTSFRGKNRYTADFSLVPKKRVIVSGFMVDDNDLPVQGIIQYFMEYEKFTEVDVDEKGRYEVELVPGNFDLRIIPEFPYAVGRSKYAVIDGLMPPQKIMVKKADVGLISLDGSDELLSYFASPLDSLELTYSFSIWENDIDKYQTLNNLVYKTVIIYTGSATPLTSVTSLLEALNDFINQGGHVVYSGQRIMEFLSMYEPFKGDGLAHAGNRNELLLYNAKYTGLPVYTSLSGAGSADNQTDPDALTVSPENTPFIYYDAQQKIIAGTIIHRNRGGGYVILGFGLESVHKPHGSSSFTSGTEMFDYLFKKLWIDSERGILVTRFDFPITENHNTIRLLQSSPNRYKGEVTIKFFIPQPASVKLELYDLGGVLVGSIMEDARDLGGYSVTWQPARTGLSMNSGMYILALRVQGTTGIEHLLLSKLVWL